MTLHHRDIHSISPTDLQQLIENQVPEGRDLDYKEVLPKETEDEKREFRFDVSSFANAVGGLIIYGIREKKGKDGPTGTPEKVVPLEVNPDKESLRLETILRAHIDPRIQGVQVRFMPVEGGHVGLIWVPRSWQGLHLVKHNDSYRFYSRHSKGKYILDATEIRSGLVASQEGYERLRRFRYERVAKIAANEGPFVLEEGPKAVMHLIPLSSTDPTIEFDLSPVRDPLVLGPVFGAFTGWNNEHNYDGFVKVVRLAGNETSNYLQFFRNGITEEVFGRIHDPDRKILGGYSNEGTCIRSLTNCMEAHKRLGVLPPFLLCLSLLGISGYTWRVESWGWRSGNGRPFRETELLLPEALVSDADVVPHTVLRPLFDRIWNASGELKSPFYDEGGNRIDPRLGG